MAIEKNKKNIKYIGNDLKNNTTFMIKIKPSLKINNFKNVINNKYNSNDLKIIQLGEDNLKFDIDKLNNDYNNILKAFENYKKLF